MTRRRRITADRVMAVVGLASVIGAIVSWQFGQSTATVIFILVGFVVLTWFGLSF